MYLWLRMLTWEMGCKGAHLMGVSMIGFRHEELWVGKMCARHRDHLLNPDWDLLGHFNKFIRGLLSTHTF